MDDKVGKAFDFAQESVKQMITLATGIVALAITFEKDFIGTAPNGVRTIALWSWGLFLLSVLFGLWALLALTGTLDARKPVPVSIQGFNVRFPTMIQILLFALGLALTVWFGVAAACSGPAVAK